MTCLQNCFFSGSAAVGAALSNPPTPKMETPPNVMQGRVDFLLSLDPQLGYGLDLIFQDEVPPQWLKLVVSCCLYTHTVFPSSCLGGSKGAFLLDLLSVHASLTYFP